VQYIHNEIMHNDVMHSNASGAELAGVLEHLVTLIRQVSTAGDLSTAASSALNRLGRDGPHRLTELAHAQGVSQPGMTQLVTRMERDGLMRRTATSDDRRAVLVEATDAGLDLVRRRRAERADALQHMLDRLDPQDQAAIAAALPALARLVEARASD
jgi:DNA-binding MarR family transcriptional regulator